jgi:hypothetical protein
MYIEWSSRLLQQSDLNTFLLHVLLKKILSLFIYMQKKIEDVINNKLDVEEAYGIYLFIGLLIAILYVLLRNL